MALESGIVATGDTILASDYNKLRNDLLVNHDHSTGYGGVVDHGDLTESANMSGMGHRHEDLDVHLAGGGPGPNSLDNYGGDRGVHGLATAVKVAGALEYQWVVQAGIVTLSAEGTANVTFSNAFSTAPYVVCTFAQAPTDIDNPDEADALYVTNRATTGFTVTSSASSEWGNKQACWIAVGTV